MNAGQVSYARSEGVAHICFDRPHARNAMTWTMYEQLAEACDRVNSDQEVRVAVFRGAGNQAFVAGTDIAQFREFRSADDGVEYERRIEACLARIETLRVPSIAAIEGWAVGGGLAIAAACDIRVATPESRFGVPIARTLGNCLSVPSLALLTATFNVTAVKRMLLLGENLTAPEAHAAGFITEIVSQPQFDARVAEFAARMCGNAPITLRVTREAIRRLIRNAMPDGTDLLRECYGSEDFRIGVDAFVQKTVPRWKGR